MTKAEYQHRYDLSEKGRARVSRYQHSEKGRTAKQAARRRADAKRIRIGPRYVGQAKTVEQAAVINAHIKRRMREFKSR